MNYRYSPSDLFYQVHPPSMDALLIVFEVHRVNFLSPVL